MGDLFAFYNTLGVSNNSPIDFTLTDTNGDEILLSSLIGEGRWLLLDFWATWCQSCMGEMPKLKEMYDLYRPYGLEICGVAISGNIDKWREYCFDNLPWINLYGGDGRVPTLYQITSIPTNFLIAPNGEIVAKDLRSNNISTILNKHLKK